MSVRRLKVVVSLEELPDLLKRFILLEIQTRD
jgi:hypothetical protein